MSVTKSAPKISTWAVLILSYSHLKLLKFKQKTHHPLFLPKQTQNTTRGMKRRAKNQRTPPRMKRSEREEEEEEEEEHDEIHDQLKHLEYDWSSSKEHLHQSADAEIMQLMDTSPRELISSLQKFHETFSSSGWKVRTNHLAVEEVIRERRAVIKSGRLKGRRLFDAFEGSGELDYQEEEKCSVSSSVMIHGSEVSSLRSNLSREDDGDEDEVGDGEGGGCACKQNMEKEEVLSVEEKVPSAEGKSGIVHRLWWMVRVAWIAFAVVVFALLIISGKSFDRRIDGRRLIPT